MNGTGAHGFILDSGIFTTVDVSGAARDTLLTGINDAGQIVGTASTGLFVKDGATFTTLDTPASWNA